MTDSEQIMRFSEALDRLVDYHREEFDLTFASAVGVLNYKAFLLMREAEQKSQEGDRND